MAAADGEQTRNATVVLGLVKSHTGPSAATGHSVSCFHKEFTSGSVLWCPSANYMQKCLDFNVSLVWKAEFLQAECYKVSFFPHDAACMLTR